MNGIIHLLIGGLLAVLATASLASTPPGHLNLEAGVAIQGYDPVAYFSGAPAKGNPEIRETVNGATYYFQSEVNREPFRADPDKYQPAFGGWCAWAMYDSGEKVEVNPESFKIVNGRLFLFYKKYFIDTSKNWNKLADKEGEQTLVGRADKAWARLTGNP